MSRISVHDFEIVLSNTDDSKALVCQSELTSNLVDPSAITGCLVGDGRSPVSCGVAGPESVGREGKMTRGWSGRRGTQDHHRVYRLSRRREIPEEGYFNCIILFDINPLSGLYILYPSEW